MGGKGYAGAAETLGGKKASYLGIAKEGPFKAEHYRY
jgi:hypothetical protein